MEISNFFKLLKNNKRIVIWALPVFLASVSLHAESPPAPKESTPEVQEIHVTADRLVSDRNNQYAEFTGNVVATRQGAVLKSNRLKITYKQTPKENSDSRGEQGSRGGIDQIIATGSVVITYEDKIAHSEKAVYTMSDETVVLTGGTPKVYSGKSYVTGEKITLHRLSGQVFVESGGSNRVSAEFHPEDKKNKTPDSDKESP